MALPNGKHTWDGSPLLRHAICNFVSDRNNLDAVFHGVGYDVEQLLFMCVLDIRKFVSENIPRVPPSLPTLLLLE